MQVQNTNDSSIISKLSSSNLGYYHDNCLKMFVEKQLRRSPIINRGYYIRFKAIEFVFQSWSNLMSSLNFRRFQIVSLGAGFDSAYFRLKDRNQFPSICRYIEIDFPEVMKRKLNYIKKSKYQKLVSETENSCDNFIASGEDYLMLGINMENTEDIEKCFKMYDVSSSLPTMFLSECALTYMETESSNHLLKWIEEKFPNSAIVMYEQILPNDGFGIVMQNHFSSLGCPLKSIGSYENKLKHCCRFTEMGWCRCDALDMLEFFMAFSEEEKRRIQALEPFDEYEMWHEKCRHYILTWACQGHIPLPAMFHRRDDIIDNVPAISRVKWKLCEPGFQRFGHQIAALSADTLLVSGGFGLSNKKHQRLGGLSLLHCDKNSYTEVQLSDPQDLLGKRIHHSVTKLANNTIVVLGGRFSPLKVFDKVVTVNVTEVLLNTFPLVVKEAAVTPLPTWRHSASVVTLQDVENIVIFGGCVKGGGTTDECYILNTVHWNWRKVAGQRNTPSPRCSHSSATWFDSSVIVSCGLSETETILESVHVLDCNTDSWSTLDVVGLLPRYSHTSHIFNDKLFLLGGVTSHSNFSICLGIIDLSTLTAIEYSSPSQTPEYPILLVNHCSFKWEDHIIVMGGGGNCFSFGTHFNSKSVKLDCSDYIESENY